MPGLESKSNNGPKSKTINEQLLHAWGLLFGFEVHTLRVQLHRQGIEWWTGCGQYLRLILMAEHPDVSSSLSNNAS